MKVYIAYKFKEEDPLKLKEKLEELDKIVKEATGWETFIFFRDVQNWNKGDMSIKEVTSKAMVGVKECDIILAECSEKARGVYFEVGYAKALGKKVIVVHKKGTEANFLVSVADKVIEYEDFKDLKEKLKT